MSEPRFVPKTVYVIYIASTPEKVWEALTSAEFTRQYFFGHSIELEPRPGGSFIPVSYTHLTLPTIYSV